MEFGKMRKHVINIIQIITMLFWILFLKNSDAYFMPYLVTSILSFICFYINYKEEKVNVERKIQILLIFNSAIFSLMVLAANYSMFSDDNIPEIAGELFRIIWIILLGNGGYFTAYNILYYAKKRLENFSWKESENRLSPLKVFLIPFLLIFIVDTLVLFMCKYPGTVTYDSMKQIDQLMTGSYSNHHPFYHTITIKLFIMLGLKIFGDINAAVATYHVFQILFMAMCFSMAVLTLYEMKISLKLIFIAIAWYAFMPFHIFYSFTMWKDVMFGGFVLLFITFIFRLMKNIGKSEIFNYIMFIISGIGMCLFRSNGFIAFIIVFITFLILFGKRNIKICIMFVSIIVISFIMKYPVLNSLGISQPDIIENLSIPAQQIARVAIEHNDFTDRQIEMLDNIIDIDEIPNKYQSYISDPIKNLVREKGNQQYIIDNKFEFIKLYINVGLKHPLSYIAAWIDMTKGYWNGGYSYTRWAFYIMGNDWGIKRDIKFEKLKSLQEGYSWIFEHSEFLSIFLSIGFHVWITLFLCFMSIVRKDKLGGFITIPIFAIIISLLIATPVYSEFRYIYALFCSLPFIIFSVFYKGNNKRGEING